MSNEIQVRNTIFRDTMLGVLFFIAAVMLLVLSNTSPMGMHTFFLALNILSNIGGVYFLLRAFKKDKYRLQTP